MARKDAGVYLLKQCANAQKQFSDKYLTHLWHQFKLPLIGRIVFLADLHTTTASPL